ncbi:YhgE/Pip domain-containing protein [Listeria booriae]|nr:YhgE/Pip domain-containing protein [Listeria booriae]
MKMIKAEWKNLLQNKVLLISFIAILSIPILYAGFFLKSVWNPYQETSHLPVAVVNEDQSITFQGQKIDVGDQLTAQLKKNHNLDWDFVSADEANKGMKDLKYYLIVKIPKDFSANAITLIDEKPKKMNLTYETNGSLNFIAEEIGEIGIREVESQVNNQVTKAYGDALVKVADKIGSGMKQAANGADQIDQGTQKLGAGNTEITDNLDKLASSTVTFSGGMNQLQNGLVTYTNGVSELDTGANKLYSGSSQLENGINELYGNIPALENGTSELQSGLTQLSAGSAKLENGLQELQQNLNAPSAKQKIKELQSGMNQFEQGLNLLNSKVNNPAIDTLENKIKSFSPVLNRIEGNLSDLETALSPSGQQQYLDQMTAQVNSTSLTPAEKQTLINNITQIFNQQVSDHQALLTDMRADINLVLNDLEDIPKGLAAVQQLQGGVSELATNFPQIKNGTNQLAGSLNTISSAVGTSGNQNTLLGGATALNAGINQAAGGVNELNAKVPVLAAGVGKLDAGSKQLNSGTAQLVAGTNKLNTNSPELLSGANKLATGSDELESGSAKLAAGSQTLGQGITKLESGSDELATKLDAAATSFNDLNVNKDNIEMLASPVKLDSKPYSVVKSYGQALAPYVMSLALYVGCLVLNFVFPIRKVSMLEQTSTAWWASKVSIGLFAAIAMAIIQVSVMLLLGLQVDNIFEFYLTALVTVLAYMAIIMFLAMAFDNPGRFAAMILLIIQLAGAGGTFPIQLTNSFFEAIHPFLPMTYSIYAFREAITGGIGTSLFTQSLTILFIIFIVFNVLLWFAMRILQKKHLDGISQLDNNQELQGLEK